MDDIPPSIAKTHEWIRKNFRRNPSLHEIADIAMYSPFHFHRLFRKAYGKTARQLVEQLRVEAAKKMLLDGVALPNIATALSFAQQTHFTHRFKRLTGLPPRKWLQSELKHATHDHCVG